MHRIENLLGENGIHAGDNQILEVTVLDEAEEPVNLTGAALTYQVARAAGGPVLLTRSGGDGIAVTDAAAGELQITLSPEETRAMTGLRYHRLLVQFNGTPRTAFSGFVHFQATPPL